MSSIHVQQQHGAIKSDMVKGEGPQPAPQALCHSFDLVKKANLFETMALMLTSHLQCPLCGEIMRYSSPEIWFLFYGGC